MLQFHYCTDMSSALNPAHAPQRFCKFSERYAFEEEHSRFLTGAMVLYPECKAAIFVMARRPRLIVTDHGLVPP